MHEVRERIPLFAEYLSEHDEEADELGRLPVETASKLREIGVIRMLQPRRHGGYEASPRDFFEAVMEVCIASPNAGWICGVVGGHPWSTALMDPRAQDDIWGENQDAWIASPYAPFGSAQRVSGGYRLSGRWPFSSGTDFCDWAALGGLIVDEQETPDPTGALRHFLLPRSDYEIDEDSWHVVGLKGSGSKDVIVTDAFVPDYRVLDPAGLDDGGAGRLAGLGSLYDLPLGFIFPGGIVAATLGIAAGAVSAFTTYTNTRVSLRRGKISEDPYQQAALGAAAADVDASLVHVLHDADEFYATVEAGGTVSVGRRVEARRNQVAATRRSLKAVDELFAHAGGTSIRLDLPLQRYWRDLHAAMNHAANVAEPLFRASSLLAFGQQAPTNARY